MFYEIILMVLHVLGAGVVIGSVFIAWVTAWKRPPTIPGLERVLLMGTYAKFGSIAQLVTGVLLYLREPDEFNEQTVFWVKLGLYVLGGILAGTVLVKQSASQLAALRQETPAGSTSSLATVTTVLLLIIIAIVSIGVFLVSGHE